MLRLERLAVSYGGAEAVRDLDLEVRAGEMVALIGANGAGKSTTLRAISGLATAARGQILFEGRPLQRLSSAAIVGLGVVHVPEGRLVFGDQTVEDNLRLGAYVRSFRHEGAAIRQDMEALLARFPFLAQRRRQFAGTLSGGEQQVLAIARALMARPRLLLLDEPSLGLAPRLVVQVFEVIAQLRDQGVTILLVEQLARQALAVADRAYVLEAGRCVLSGPAAEVAEHPAVLRAYLGVGAG
ncbi:MAG: ABC transporter ATP-binding protein [Chloroflexi bacterium]|nr:ABC transporter ATP-binding protein [Chloroflexota bacterium]